MVAGAPALPAIALSPPPAMAPPSPLIPPVELFAPLVPLKEPPSGLPPAPAGPALCAPPFALDPPEFVAAGPPPAEATPAAVLGEQPGSGAVPTKAMLASSNPDLICTAYRSRANGGS